MQTSYFQSRGDMHSQKSQSAEMQCCGTFNQTLYSQLHLYIGEDLEQSRKGNESNPTGIFPSWFLWGGQRNQTFTSFCEILTGETLGYLSQQGKSKDHHTRQQPGQHKPHSTHTSAHAYCQVQAMGKKQGLWRTRDLQKALSLFPKLFIFMNLSKEAFTA